jgi:poly(glycerol-phosphate) alpha-glucosyltransferase
MKAAFLIASVSRKAGGLFESVRRLAQSLHAHHCQVDVYSSQDEFTATDLPSWQPLVPVTFPVIGPRQFGYSPGLGRALRGAAADVLNVHGIWMYPSVLGRAWARRTTKPLIVHPHGMLDPWAVRHRRWKKIVASWVYEDAQLRRAACVRALCQAEAQAIRQYGLQNPICVIPNGIDVPEQLSAALPPWAGVLDPGRRVLLYLGRIHPKKGLASFLQGWKELQHHNPEACREWATAIAGWDQNGHEHELRTLTRTLGLERDVAFVGPQFGEGKAACYSHASAFILPSVSEGLPMAVLEAWAYGLPVVLTPPCNLPEGVAAEAAIEVSPAPRDLARGLLELFRLSDEQRREMGRRGRELVVRRFYWPRIATQMQAVYQWVLGGGDPPPCIWSENPKRACIRPPPTRRSHKEFGAFKT